MRTCGLAQHHTIGGEGQGAAKPVLSPVLRLAGIGDAMAEGRAIGKAKVPKLGQPLRRIGGAVRPVPDEQADAGGFLGGKRLARQQSGDPCAGALAAAFGLHMARQAPVQFALQHGIERLGELCGHGGQSAHGCRPVLAVAAIAPADGLCQPAGAVRQGHRHAIHLGLDPHRLAPRQPALDLIVRQLVQPGLRHRMGDGAGQPGQGLRCGRRLLRKAVAPTGEALAGLVVEFVGNGRATIAVVGAVPLRQLADELAQFGRGALAGPVGAGLGQRHAQAERGQQRRANQGHECIRAGNRSGSIAKP